MVSLIVSNLLPLHSPSSDHATLTVPGRFTIVKVARNCLLAFECIFTFGANPNMDTKFSLHFVSRKCASALTFFLLFATRQVHHPIAWLDPLVMTTSSRLCKICSSFTHPVRADLHSQSPRHSGVTLLLQPNGYFSRA